jgi:aldehyde dehydrogenase (NAD+)
MGYIESGKEEGATVHLGGDRFGTEGYYINPTIFTNTTPEMKIVKEEIFGPVGVVIKFEDEDGKLFPSASDGTEPAIQMLSGRQMIRVRLIHLGSMASAYSSFEVYGLAAGVFSQDIDRAIRTAHRIQAGTVWVI